MTTTHGVVRSDHVVRCTEGFTPMLPGQRRRIVPIYSLMIATEPLPVSFWDEVGLRRRETFSDGRRLIVYGQRTADDRLAFGGRGAPYHFGSRVDPAYDRDDATHDSIHRARGSLPGGPRRGDHPPVGRTRGCAATGTARSATTAPPGSPGRAATSATASAPPTSPGARCAT
ncbi:MAG: FAD-dependent oxidoreductase [Ilumatobacteraceae bacterium]